MKKKPTSTARKRNGSRAQQQKRTTYAEDMSDEEFERLLAEAEEKKEEVGDVESTYRKMNQVEHILKRPDSYVGSCERMRTEMLVFEKETRRLRYKEIEYTPALYKIFDEILVNATDHKQRCPKKMNLIKVTIDADKGEISVWNNGTGIPVRKHKRWKSYVIEGIFGSLLCGSNFNDEQKKTTGGRNGYGAKLTNVYSTRFEVETSSYRDKKRYKQVWTKNMSQRRDPTITDLPPSVAKRGPAGDYTKITFRPDLKRFKMDRLDEDIVALMTKRCYDAAAVSRARVKLNGEAIPIKSFSEYVKMVLRGKLAETDAIAAIANDDRTNPPTATTASGADDASSASTAPSPNEDPLPQNLICKTINKRWEVGITLSPHATFQQISFVNGIATTKGGSHVAHVESQILKHLVQVLSKKAKRMGVRITKNAIRNHIFLCVNCLVENPSFDSQTKEQLTTPAEKFGSTCKLPATMLRDVAGAKLGLVELVTQMANFKAQISAAPSAKGKKRTVRGIKKLDDANHAGTSKSDRCTLVLTEGDSAKTLAVCGLSVVGRDDYGVFPLKGKPLNVREANLRKIQTNQEIQNIIKILGLKRGTTYTKETIKSLRYGSVMIMADQDYDGSHIKGLIMNFLHWYNPSLLRVPNFVKQFITPIVKATKGNTTKSFFTVPKFLAWKNRQTSLKGWRFKYYKGLGTNTSKEAKTYFRALNRHVIPFAYSEPAAERATTTTTTTGDASSSTTVWNAPRTDDAWIDLVFSKANADERKRWLKTYVPESSIDYEATSIGISTFLRDEYVHYSASSVRRAIPSVVDGLKPSQRKALFACFKRKLKREIKVAQLVGYISEHTAYHHGEKSMEQTVVKLAQNFVGSNNVNLLYPGGQFGSRLMGGKDAASSRYIFTRLAEITRTIFPEADDAVLEYLEDEGDSVEPKFYVPIVPLVLINGCAGIGTGWSTKVLNHNPFDVIANVRRMIRGEEPKTMLPFYVGYEGRIERVGGPESRKFVSRGTLRIDEDGRRFRIKELPIGVWTQDMKERLEDMIGASGDSSSSKRGKSSAKSKKRHSPERSSKSSKKKMISITGYREYHTETTVHFDVDVTEETAKTLRSQPDGGMAMLIGALRLEKSLSMDNMQLWGAENTFVRRFKSGTEIVRAHFEIRKRCYESRLAHQIRALKREYRKIDSQVRFVRAVLKGTLELRQAKMKILNALDAFRPKLFVRGEDEEDEEGTEDAEDAEDESNRYDYLLKMPLYSLTTEKVEQLEAACKKKMRELQTLMDTKPDDVWSAELDVLESKLKVLVAERECEKVTALKKIQNQVESQNKRLEKKRRQAKRRRERKTKKAKKLEEASLNGMLMSSPLTKRKKGKMAEMDSPASTVSSVMTLSQTSVSLTQSPGIASLTQSPVVSMSSNGQPKKKSIRIDDEDDSSDEEMTLIDLKRSVRSKKAPKRNDRDDVVAPKLKKRRVVTIDSDSDDES